jgi:rhodanese-related sulfurtransferase
MQNRKKLAVVTLLSLIAAAPLAFAAEGGDGGAAQGAPQSRHAPPPSKAHVLSRAELDQLLAQPDKVLIIDVRRPDEIANIGGLPVYLNIQVKALKNSLAWIPKDRTIVTLSNHAGRAGRAADILAAAGFKVAGAAGAQTYEKEGGTVVKYSAPARGGADGGVPTARQTIPDPRF